jgi:hypothetical protein
MAESWEYQTVQSWKQAGQPAWSGGLEQFLNGYGAQGWELVSVVEQERNGVSWIFKRRRSLDSVGQECLASASSRFDWGFGQR